MMLLFDSHAALAEIQGPANRAKPAKQAAPAGQAPPAFSRLAGLAGAKPQRHTHPPAHWQIRYAAHLAALKADASVVWVSEAVVDSVAHLRTAWDWLADNDPPVGTYTEEECQARLSRARAALTAHGVKPCIPLEDLDRGHIARIRAEGAQELLDDLTERWGQMCGGPEYPDDAHALVAALEDVRGRYTHANT
jgi:hypothetical protein